MQKILEAAKAIIALVGSIATALLASYGPDGEYGQILTVIAIIATAVTTYVVPNAKPVEDVDDLPTDDPHGGLTDDAYEVEAEPVSGNEPPTTDGYTL